MQFMKDSTSDDVFQKMITLQRKLEESLEEVQREHKLIIEERHLMEGD